MIRRRLVWTVLVAVLGGCPPGTVRPIDETDPRWDTDTDTDTGTDTGTDTARPQCGPELDEGWRYTRHRHRGATSAAAWGGGRVLLAGGLRDHPIVMLDLESWRDDTPAESLPHYAGIGGTGAAYLLGGPATFREGVHEGLAVQIWPNFGDEPQRISLWSNPDFRGQRVDASTDASIDGFVGGAAVADLDGDGLDDVYLTREPDSGASMQMLSPLSGAVSAEDGHPVPRAFGSGGGRGVFFDWNEDGYADHIGQGGGVYLGPLAELDVDSIPDLQFDLDEEVVGDGTGWAILPPGTPGTAPADVDGDGVPEIWASLNSNVDDPWVRVNYPGPGAHVLDELPKVGFRIAAKPRLSHTPIVSDLNGDGLQDVAFSRTDPNHGFGSSVAVLAGPLTELHTPAEEGLWLNGLPRGFSHLENLGDLNGDGRGDFAAFGFYDAEADEYYSTLWLGCPDW